MPTFVPRLTPRLRRKLAKRFARRSKSRHESSRRYGASGCAAAMRLASRQVTALSRSSDGLTSTSAVSEPYSRAFRSRNSVMTMKNSFKARKNAHCTPVQRTRNPVVPPLFAACAASWGTSMPAARYRAHPAPPTDRKTCVQGAARNGIPPGHLRCLAPSGSSLSRGSGAYLCSSSH